MRSRSVLRSLCLILALASAASLAAQRARPAHAPAPTLQKHYDAAQNFQRTGDLTAAAQEYRAFLADALGELALEYALVPDYTRAAPLFDEALALQPDSPTLLLDDAQAALTGGDLTHARTLAATFVRRYPNDRPGLARAHQLLGRVLLKLNQDQDARKEFELAVALDPTFANGYDLGVACLDLNDEKCAVQVFTEMERSFGDTAEIHLAFGRAYGDSDFQPRAIAEFRKAIAENPRLPGAHYLLAAILLATGNDQAPVETAQAELKKELAISPRDPMTYAALGKIAVTRTSYAEAETYLHKAISLDPQSPDAFLYLGQLYFDTNRLADAETALRQSIALTKDPSRNRFQVQKAHFLLGRILMKKGQPEAAHKEMQIERELAGRNLAEDKSKLAGLMETSGSSESSAAAATTARTQNPSALRNAEATRQRLTPAVADSYNNLGAIAATNADYAAAVHDFQRASEWNPSLEGLDVNWGRAAFAASQYAEAIPPLSRYLKSHPEDAGGRSILGLSQFLAGKFADCTTTLQPIANTALAPQVDYAYAVSLVHTGQVPAGTERLLALEKSHPEIPDVHRALADAYTAAHRPADAQKELALYTSLTAHPQDGHPTQPPAPRDR